MLGFERDHGPIGDKLWPFERQRIWDGFLDSATTLGDVSLGQRCNNTH